MNNKKNSRRSFLQKGAVAGLTGAGILSTFGQGLNAAVVKQNRYSNPSDLKITDVKCGFVRGAVYVKIYTNQDVWGCGEAVDAIHGSYYLVKRLGNQLRGQNPLNPNRLAEQIRKGAFFGGAQSGVFVAVLTAIETALWDITGKVFGVPVYQLLGGKYRDKIRVYCDTALYTSTNPSPSDYASAARGAVDRGYNAVKFDVDDGRDPNKYDRYNWTASPAEIDRMYNAIAAVREEVGPNIDICVDMHGRYDAVTGMKMAKMYEPLNLMWLEEPVPADNPEVYKHITQETSTPICTGENIYLAYGFTKLLSDGAVDIIMPDLQKAGGLGEGQRIANLANLYYVPFSPHMVASFLGAMASCHVCASVPNFQVMEWQIYMDTDQLWQDIVTYDGPRTENSFITLSEKPGIGVEINEEGMKKHAVPGIPFFE
ncbi:mandelate racemase/muconate lactonizing enzyme family protein [Algoriphagus halophytocola]|uniref:Mandelate racemase/muconate lactonizing enzyme family protein n=1 Tax=Algoriphagus halophytocola TaxID=2991499 RepID=A0ABY6MG61_9BACT|nr:MULTISPECIES: mandelate racemase/muconate lactonizing enzyme family protein [unclassified Algoriphagus]UZD22623.1 mandelate racemase/muconate lactonizing enzyme family protein [Algoriphagus sp. TR-M5]WBL43889.1 mandelate racemase/muconate lactonizing enzyme family protein [Algoriphagus sp. TR-M9]